MMQSASGTPTVGSKAAFGLVLLAVAILVAWLHLCRLGEMPGAPFNDEVSIGYNAWCIRRTGCDEYGTPFPLSFRGYGNHHDGVLVYSIVPWITADRLNVGYLRLPSALYFLAAVPFVGLLASRYTAQNWFGLAGGLLFGCLPWTFAMCRTTIGGYAPMLLGISVGWYGLLRAADGGSKRWATLAAVGWALASYAHHTGRPMTALLLVAYLFMSPREIWRCRSAAGVFALLLSLLAAPLLWYAWHTPEYMTARFQSIAVASQSAGFAADARKFFDRYFAHFGPSFLFLKGDPNPVLHTGVGGVLFASTAPMVLAGIVDCVRVNSSAHRFLLSAIALFPVAASLTIDPVHASRSVNGAPFFCVLAAVGAQFLWKRGSWARLFALICCIGVLAESCRYLQDYFGNYWERAAPSFDDEFQRMLRISLMDASVEQPLTIDRASLPWPVDSGLRPVIYAQILYWGRVEPAEYMRHGIPAQRIVVVDRPSIARGYFVCRSEPRQTTALGVPSGNSLVAGRSEFLASLLAANAKLMSVVPIRSATLRHEAFVSGMVGNPNWRDWKASVAQYELWQVP